MTGLEHHTSLVDKLLAEQAQLGTAVERFADWHERDGHAEPLQARHYRSLIPMLKPQRGEQYAFEVNLDQCTGCKACVAACHSLNGLDDDESWRDVGLLVGDVYIPYQQTITTACHHCADPACANGCPVLAYEKDPETGIVRHLDDQCIGCSYCILKCPYDVPKFNKRRGIVRKCDMCHQRLSVGEAPACVQSCPNGAIAIRVVDIAEVTARAAQPAERVLPDSFTSSYTKPTTRYMTDKVVPASAQSPSRHELVLEEAHWPLAWMLVLTQMAAGLFVAAAVAAGNSSASSLVSLAGCAVLAVGLTASVMHLGQPLRAWRCFLGWRKSWLSREILAFGGFFKVGVIAWWFNWPLLLAAASMVGLASVYCSAMVYIDTQRSFWKAGVTFPKFFGTTLLLGTAGAAALLACMPGHAETHRLTQAFALAATVIRMGLFAFEQRGMRRAAMDPDRDWHRSAKTLMKLRSGTLDSRLILVGVSTVLGVMSLISVAGMTALWAVLSLAATFASQVLERHLFFVGVTAPRMPGVVPVHSSHRT